MRPTETSRSESPVAVALIDRESGARSSTPAFVTVDAKSLMEMARNSVSGGKFTAQVPLRTGEATLPVTAEGVRLDIPAGAKCTASATIAPTAEGLKVTRARIAFDQPIQVVNPGSLIGAERANEAATVHVTEIGFDALGQMSVEGSFKPNLGRLSKLIPAIPLSTLANRFLKQYDLRLEAFLKPASRSVPAAAPKSSALDPKKLVAALSTMIAKTSFDLRIDGPKDGPGGLRVHGELDSPEPGTLTGDVTGDFDGNLRVSVEAAGNGSSTSGALNVRHEDDRFVIQTGSADLGRALARQLGAIAGDRLNLDTALSATLAHSIAIAISPEGSMGVTLTKVGATLALKNAAASSPLFKMRLADPSSATFGLDYIKAGAEGVALGKPTLDLDVKVAQGELAFGTGSVRLKEGTHFQGGVDLTLKR